MEQAETRPTSSSTDNGTTNWLLDNMSSEDLMQDIAPMPPPIQENELQVRAPSPPPGPCPEPLVGARSTPDLVKEAAMILPAKDDAACLGAQDHGVVAALAAMKTQIQTRQMLHEERIAKLLAAQGNAVAPQLQELLTLVRSLVSARDCDSGSNVPAKSPAVTGAFFQAPGSTVVEEVDGNFAAHPKAPLNSCQDRGPPSQPVRDSRQASVAQRGQVTCVSEPDVDTIRDAHSKEAICKVATDNSHKSQQSRRNKSGLFALCSENVLGFYDMSEDLSPPRKLARYLVNHKGFDYAVSVLITVSAVTTGVQVDWAMRNIDDMSDPPVDFRSIDLFFTAFFACEITLRFANEMAFFISPLNFNLRWNVFDSLLTLSSILQEIVTSVTEGSAANASPVRLLRIMRLVRVIRVIRVMRFFADLRVMVSGIMSSMKSLVWAMLLLLIVMFIFSVGFMQLISDEIQASKELGEEVEHLDALLESFGSLLQALFIMFQCITSGADWGQIAGPLVETHALTGPLFILYIAFGVLCVLNIVTGVFVENAKKITAQDEEHMILEELEARELWVNECKALFHYADADNSGEVTWQEFEDAVKQPRIMAFMRKIGLDVHSEASHALFSLLDFDDDGKLELEEFVEGAQQLHGSAKSLDMARVKYMARELDRKLSELTDVCCRHFQCTPPREKKTRNIRETRKAPSSQQAR